MEPIEFIEANHAFFGPPDPLPEPVGRVGVLWARKGCGLIVSCWRPTWRERLSVLLFGRVWLAVVGDLQPPVSIQVCRSYFKPNPEWSEKASES